MATGKNTMHRKKYNERARRVRGAIILSIAKKKLEKLTKKQKKNQKRGRKGHTPKPRKILKK